MYDNLEVVCCKNEYNYINLKELYIMLRACGLIDKFIKYIKKDTID